MMQVVFIGQSFSDSQRMRPEWSRFRRVGISRVRVTVLPHVSA
jgi:hypothetical protein